MKKWRSAVLLLAIMAAVTGCGKDENNNTTGASVNTTTETNNFQALKMYRNLGFKEDYNYPQSYLPVKN